MAIIAAVLGGMLVWFLLAAIQRRKKGPPVFWGGVAAAALLYVAVSINMCIRLLTITEPQQLDPSHEAIVAIDAPRPLLGPISLPTATQRILLYPRPSVDLSISFPWFNAESLDSQWGFLSGDLLLQSSDGTRLTVPMRPSSASGNGSNGAHWGSWMGGGPGQWTSGGFTPACIAALPAEILQLPAMEHLHKVVTARASLSVIYPVGVSADSFTNHSSAFSREFEITVVPRTDIELKEHWDLWNRRASWPVHIVLAALALGVTVYALRRALRRSEGAADATG